MSDYRAPIDDMMLALTAVAGLDDLSKYERFGHADVETVEGILREAARFVESEIAPLNRVGDATGASHNEDGSVTSPDGFRDAYDKLVEAGWPVAAFPSEWGGGDLPFVVGVAIQEMVTSANMAFALCPMLTYGAVEMLLAHGDDEQRGMFIEKLITGEWSGTMVLTEPDAGSDVGALNARAQPKGDGTWSIKGTKIFITCGEHDLTENIIHMVLARVPDAPPGTRGISCFIVPKYLVNADGSLGERNDVTCVSIEHKLGIHGTPTCVLSFGENGGATGYLIGEANHGMHYMFTMMNNARLQVGLQGLGIAERAYQQALAYARERRQGRAVGAPRTEHSPIIDHPDVQRMLMLMRSQIEAMRGVMYLNAAAIDRAHHAPEDSVREQAEELAGLLTPVSKGWGTDLGVELTSVGLQVHGGMGFIEETGAAQHYRDARIAPIYEGTNGIQAIDLVMRKLPIRGGDAVRDLLAEMRGTAAELVDQAISALLGESIERTTEATEWLLGREHPNDALAGASPYLRLLGITAGGWVLAREHLAAPDDTEKAGVLSFYAHHVLPQTSGLLPSVTAGAGSLHPSIL